MNATARTSGHAPTERGNPPRPPQLPAIEAKRRRTQLHLVTYLVGNALFWTLWGAISVSTDHWYWWPIIPFAGWTLVLGSHIWHVYRSPGGLDAR